MESAGLLYRVMVLMEGRRPMSPVDAAFVFGRAHGDWEGGPHDTGILETAAMLYRMGTFSSVVIPSQEGGVALGGKKVDTTFPGSEVFRQRLMDEGVPATAIFTPGPYVVHMRGEGDAYVLLAKEMGWRRAVAFQNPHQALRTMLGLLRSFEVHHHPMDIVPVSPQSVSWSRKVYGSQGKWLLARHDHIQEEWDRILRYQASTDPSGNLASLEELEEYLTPSE